MHPELYYVVYQQVERERDQRLARALMLRERGLVGPAVSDRFAGLRRLAGSARARVIELRASLGRIETRPNALECCAAA